MKTPPRRSVLITGASRRVGRHLALGLARAGWEIHLHYNSSREAAEDTARLIVQAGGTCQLHQADLGNAGEAEALLRHLPYGDGVMGLLHNASLFEYDTAQTVSAAMLEKHLAVNLTAPAVMTRVFAEEIRKRYPATSGAVVSITDAKLAGLNPDYFSYTLSKIALDGLTTLAAQAYAPEIRVNAIAPGIILRSGDQTEEEYRIAHQRNPLGQGAVLDDILRATIMLLDTPSMTGHTVVLDGGLHLNPHHRDVAFLDETEDHDQPRSAQRFS
ncbi:SDR family oxidoreductase [Alphaproteobacteria bacterium LSUCC0684]